MPSVHLTATLLVAPGVVRRHRQRRRRRLCLVLGALACLLTSPEARQAEPTLQVPHSVSSAGDVLVNRTVPLVPPPSSRLELSADPSVDEIFRARVLAEPLVPVGGDPSAGETRALATALRAYVEQGRILDLAPFETFLGAFPGSVWRASLQANLGGVYWANGRLTHALAAWDEAWRLAKDRDTPHGRAVAGAAMGSMLEVLALLGKVDALEERVRALGAREIGGAAGAKVRHARLVAAQLRRDPDHVIPSGTQAVALVRAGLESARADAVRPAPGSAIGQTLAAVRQVAAAADLDMVMAVRPRGAALPVPAIVHLNLGHYSAVVAERQGRYLLADPALGHRRWIAGAALDEEGSGYVLIMRGSRPATWQTPTEEEASAVIGHSCPPGNPGINEPPVCPLGSAPGTGGGGGAPVASRCGGPGCGMATFQLKPESAGLVIVDTPAGYVPPRGPAVPFTLTYDYRQTLQPQIFSYGHVGPQWTFGWLSYAKEVPLWVDPGWSNEYVPEHVAVYLRGSGDETFMGPPDASGQYPRHRRSRASLVRVSTDPIRYERRLPDGSVEVFALPDTAPPGERRVFLTEVRDARGQAVTLTYDAQYRLIAVTDALGQVSTLGYDWPGDPLKVTRFTDPFGRSASLTYTPAGQLATVTDVGGLVSAVTYQDGDFIGALTTPYGTTTFRHEVSPGGVPFIEARNPLGGVRRVEYHWSAATIVPASVPAADVPEGFAAWNTDLDDYVTLSWDERAWAAGPGTPSTATVTQWFLRADDGPYATAFTAPVPRTVQRPGEARVWYAYPGQARTQPETRMGWTVSPSEVARVRPDGTTQRTLTEFNDLGHMTSRTDPVGRTTTFTYAANAIDLLAVRQVTPSGTDLVAQYGSYTDAHVPQTVTDAAGQTTTLSYTATGQVATVTNARGETTTYAYDAQDRLESVTGPMTGATTTYTYDAYGRLRTVTDPDGATVTTDYDVFDRPTTVTYPDGTTEATTYDRLEVATHRDRAGRVTRYVSDALRRRVATRDPAGRTIRQTYGPLSDQLIDAHGHATTWERDLQGRVVREVRADGLTATAYTYDTLGRLTTVTDAKGQVTTYTYTADDAVAGLAWTNAAIATPAGSYTYDSVYARVATMTDGTGTTSYTYHPAGQAGAGQVATVDGPLADDVVAYSYDALGRVVGRTIDGPANALTLAYDALGRVTQEVNALGTFLYGYDGVSGRLATVTYPNGQTSSYTYLPASQDHRLQTIHHRLPGQTTLSRFAYTYDVVGNIVTWTQQAGTAAPHVWRYGYDRADQLTRAVEETTDPTPLVLARYGYGYDPAGNRTYEQIDDQVTSWTHDALNRLVTQAGGGVLRVAGTVSEPAAVTVNGQPAAVTADQAFAAGVPVTAGTNVLTVTATDPSGNTATAAYEVDVADAPKTFTYDANGNLTSDGTRTFEWDARNQLVAVTVGTHRSEFVYDGLQRRVRQVEKDNGVTTADTRVLWCETAICEERAADGVTVTRRAFALGEQASGVARFFASDHLGSVGEVTNGSSTLLARYAYDPWGRRSVTAGADVTTVGYTGHQWQATGGVWLTQYRGYDQAVGRWISEDPIGLSDGPNLFGYAYNSPTVYVDSLGLQAAQALPLITKACELIGRYAVGALAVLSSALSQCKDDECAPSNKGCKPCEPPVGTVAYRADTNPSSRPHRGVPPPHWKLYVMMQSPWPVCKCFWSPVPDNRGGFGPGDPPPGVPPIGPAKGGGPR